MRQSGGPGERCGFCGARVAFDAQQQTLTCSGCGELLYDGLDPEWPAKVEEKRREAGRRRAEHHAEGRAVEAHQEAKHGDW